MPINKWYLKLNLELVKHFIMANNHSVNCGILMTVVMNKNYIEYAFSKLSRKIDYKGANESLINIFWTELNNKVTRIFEKPYLFDNDYDIVDAIWDEAIELIENNRYPFSAEYIDEEEEEEEEAEEEEESDEEAAEEADEFEYLTNCPN